jgi:hypothetical protein
VAFFLMARAAVFFVGFWCALARLERRPRFDGVDVVSFFVDSLQASA